MDRPARRRSRSPHPAAQPLGYRPSPFFAPPGWEPPRPRVDRAIIMQIDMKPMQHLAMMGNHYDIHAPQVGTHLSNDDYTALFTLYKVIYPNYASRHDVQELYHLVVATFSSCWSIFFQQNQFLISLNTSMASSFSAI